MSSSARVVSDLEQRGLELSAMFAKKRPSQLKGAVGVTTFISETLRMNRPFRRPNTVAGKKTFREQRHACAKGQHVGRRVDQMVRDWIVTGSAKPPAATPAVCRRATGVMRALSARGIKAVAAQVLAVDRGLGICSYIDAVGIDRKSTIWVIELKCTTDTVSAHEFLYRQPANKSKAPMANGMADHQQNHHFLQAGFGAHALRRSYATDLRPWKIKPCVVVSCTNGTQFYAPGPIYSNPLTFSSSTPRAAPIPKRKAPKSDVAKYALVPWPPDMAAVWPAAKKIGYTHVEPVVDPAQYAHCAVLKHGAGETGAHAVALCVTRPWKAIPQASKAEIFSHLHLVIDSVCRRRPKLAPSVAVVFAPTPGRVWDVAAIKKYAVGSFNNIKA